MLYTDYSVFTEYYPSLPVMLMLMCLFSFLRGTV